MDRDTDRRKDVYTLLSIKFLANGSLWAKKVQLIYKHTHAHMQTHTRSTGIVIFY